MLHFKKLICEEVLIYIVAALQKKTNRFSSEATLIVHYVCSSMWLSRLLLNIDSRFTWHTHLYYTFFVRSVYKSGFKRLINTFFCFSDFLWFLHFLLFIMTYCLCPFSHPWFFIVFHYLWMLPSLFFLSCKNLSTVFYLNF